MGLAGLGLLIRVLGAAPTAKGLVGYGVGARVSMEHVTDGDLASNDGGWQRVASAGTDAPPSFRVVDPTIRAGRHDPDGAYIRRWVPGLARVPTESIREPWTGPGGVQRAAGRAIGRDYPAPIVDHAPARALARRLQEARDAASRREGGG